MTAFAALTLTNAAATGVVFAPQTIDPSGIARWMTGDAVFDSKSTATMSVTVPKGQSSVTRVKQKIVIPHMDTVDTSKKLAESYVNIEYVLAKRATLTNRNDLLAYTKALAAHAATAAALASFEGVF